MNSRALDQAVADQTDQAVARGTGHGNRVAVSPGPAAASGEWPAAGTPKPRLLDLYCGAGGAARGYQLAGWHVTGVDCEPQPRYAGDVFIRADAMTFPLDGYDAVHASPPCRDHTSLTSVAGTDGSGWLLDATRERLTASGVPWVIENVPGAPMRADVVLCGAMFGLRTYRHRWFELSDPMLALALLPHRRHRVRTVTSRRREAWAAGLNVSITGDVGTYLGPEAMGIDWMTGNELSQAIPPAYTRFIGEQLLTAMTPETRRRVAGPQQAVGGVDAGPAVTAVTAPAGPAPLHERRTR